MSGDFPSPSHLSPASFSVHNKGEVHMKYEFVGEDVKVVDNVEVKRIRALKDVRPGVNKGDLGGYIEEGNLSQIGSCWVAEDAVVMNTAKVCGDALITGMACVKNSAVVIDNALIKDRSTVMGGAYICDKAVIGDMAMVTDKAKVYGEAKIKGAAEIKEMAEVRGKAKIGLAGHLTDFTQIYGNSLVEDEAEVCGNSQIFDEARVYGDSVIMNRAEVGGTGDVSGRNKCLCPGDEALKGVDLTAYETVGGVIQIVQGNMILTEELFINQYEILNDYSDDEDERKEYHREIVRSIKQKFK